MKKYDVEYIKSSNYDKTKIVENKIKDLILDGNELESILKLTPDEIDYMIYSYEDDYNYPDNDYIMDEFDLKCYESCF